MLDEPRLRAMLDLTSEKTSIDFQDIGFGNLRYVYIFPAADITLFLRRWLASYKAVIDRVSWSLEPATFYLFNYDFMYTWLHLCELEHLARPVYKISHPEYNSKSSTFCRWLDPKITLLEYETPNLFPVTIYDGKPKRYYC